MPAFRFFNQKTRHHFLGKRAGETKFGEALSLVSSFEELQKTKAKYVIFGIPEDIGIRANFGKPGAGQAWESFLSAFLNIQSNQYNSSENCLILGHLDCKALMKEAEEIQASSSTPEKDFGPLVEKIDTQVAKVIKKIVSVEKIPIIIGGGHNNAYGNIKGGAQGTKNAINILNIDAHTDLRKTDYRHSGNGFSYARKEGFLAKYALFGIHKNYTPQYIFDEFKNDKSINIDLYEDLFPLSEQEQQKHFQNAMNFLDNHFGLEIDCDAIEYFSSSAVTPSGFSIQSIRNFLNQAKTQKIHYLHLAEAAPNGNPQIGKALSYFISDFIRR